MNACSVTLAGGATTLWLTDWTPIAAVGLNASYDSLLSGLLQTLIFLANLAGGLVVGVGTVRGLITYLGELLRSRGGDVPKEGIRLSLGRSLALALEFQLGADILGTALNPSLRDVTILAAIVVLRTALNFFLQRELAEAQRREAEAGSPRATPGPAGVWKGPSGAVPAERETSA